MSGSTGDDGSGGGEPHPTDRHVGVRLRLRRRDLGLSQHELAHAVGVTFQQVQKYESGSNRVSASRLWELAAVLRVPIGFFFEGLPEAPSEGLGSRLADVDAFLRTPAGLDLAVSFLGLSPSLRRCMLDLVRDLAREAGGEVAA